jgi:hypothetical protein
MNKRQLAAVLVGATSLGVGLVFLARPETTSDSAPSTKSPPPVDAPSSSVAPAAASAPLADTSVKVAEAPTLKRDPARLGRDDLSDDAKKCLIAVNRLLKQHRKAPIPNDAKIGVSDVRAMTDGFRELDESRRTALRALETARREKVQVLEQELTTALAKGLPHRFDETKEFQGREPDEMVTLHTPANSTRTFALRVSPTELRQQVDALDAATQGLLYFCDVSVRELFSH